MRFFAKITLLCNSCFVIAVIMHYLKVYQNSGDFPQPLNALKGTAVILGHISWIINGVFVIVWVINRLARKEMNIARWLIVCNVVILFAQIYWFFIDKG